LKGKKWKKNISLPSAKENTLNKEVVCQVPKNTLDKDVVCQVFLLCFSRNTQ
jgi:hypothetical protein